MTDISDVRRAPVADQDAVRRCPVCEGAGLRRAWVSVERGLDYVPCATCDGVGSLPLRR